LKKTLKIMLAGSNPGQAPLLKDNLVSAGMDCTVEYVPQGRLSGGDGDAFDAVLIGPECTYDDIWFDSLRESHPEAAIIQTGAADGKTLAVKIRQALRKKKTQDRNIFSAMKDLQKNELFRRIIEKGWDIVYSLDAKGRFRYIGPQVERYGYESQELLGKTFEPLIHPEDKAYTQKIIKDCLENRREGSAQFRILSTRGDVRWHEIIYRPLIDENGEVIGADGVARDITELHRERDINRSLIDFSPAFFVTTDPNLKIIRANTAFLAATGYKEAEVLGQDLINTFLSSGEPDSLRDEFRKTPDGLVGGISRIRCRDGREISVEWRSRLFYSPDGQVEMILAVGLDTTERSFMETELAEREARYRTVFEHSGTAISIVEADGTISLVNSLFEELSGYKRSEVEGHMRWSDFVARRTDQERMQRYYEERRKPGGWAPRQYEFAFLTRDGGQRDVVINMEFILGTGRSIFSMLDINDRKRIERALIESENRYRRMFRSSPVPLWEEDISELRNELEKLRSQGVRDIRDYLRRNPEFVRRTPGMIHIVDVNEAALDLYGVSSREDLLITLEKVIGPESIASLEANIAAVFEGAILLQGESLIHTADGSRRRVYFRVAIPSWHSSYANTLTSIMDITALKEAEQQLLQERERLERKLRNEALLGAIASRLNSSGPFDSMLADVLGPVGQRLGADRVSLFRLEENGSATLIHCWRGENADKSFDIAGDGKQPAFFSLLRNNELVVLDSLARLYGEERLFLERRGCRALLAVPLSPGGRLKGFLSLSSVSEKQWQDDEKALIRTVSDMLSNAWEREELFLGRLEAEHRQVEAVRMAEKASRLASLGNLSAGVAHEINQPLTALKIKVDSYLYWMELEKEPTREKYIETLEFVSEQAGRIDQIIRHMRSLIRQDSHREPVPVGVNEVVQSALSLLDEQLMSHRIRIEKTWGVDIPAILSQPALLEQVVINLVVNAMNTLDQLGGETKLIRVSTRREEQGGCSIIVRDNGPSVPVELLDHVFDPFFGSRRGLDNPGLGLSITENIVTGLGGAISVSNHEEGGCQFRVYLPQAQ